MTRPHLPRRVRVVEVGPRDGLQNERGTIDTATKAALVDALSEAGLPVIEVGAFVSPRWVPQMADTADVFQRIRRHSNVQYTALVPNLTGLQRAVECGVSEIAIFTAASETFSQRNINQTVDDSLGTYAEVARRAIEGGLRVRAYLSTAFGCPFEGAVPANRVSELSARLHDLGAYQVAVSDTIGVAHPGQVWDVLETIERRLSLDAVALHFHDTRGTALANVLAGLEAGVETFDASAGGLGGCPYAPGAAGNLATEDLVYLLDGLQIETGVDVTRVSRASELIEPYLGHPLPSRYVQATRTRSRAD
jgi:isopropylmalate/homocitrate/citramalate synthase